jgi:hypothetical protein
LIWLNLRYENWNKSKSNLKNDSDDLSDSEILNDDAEHFSCVRAATPEGIEALKYRKILRQTSKLIQS